MNLTAIAWLAGLFSHEPVENSPSSSMPVPTFCILITFRSASV